MDLIGYITVVYLTNRFHVAVRLFSNRSKMIDLKNISFRIRTVHNPSPLFKSSREGGNITHFAKLLSKIDRDMNFFATFNFNYYTSDSL